MLRLNPSSSVPHLVTTFLLPVQIIARGSHLVLSCLDFFHPVIFIYQARDRIPISVLNKCVPTNLFATNTPFLTLLLKLVLTLISLPTPSHRGKSKRNTSDGQLMATANGALGVMRAEHSANTARIFRAHC